MGACSRSQWDPVIAHGLQKGDTFVDSFFKVVISNEFLKTLPLPPSFARTVPHLADQEIYLVDITGKKSKATISKCDDGTLAIRHGWHEFASEHNIKRGEFLSFFFTKAPVEQFVIYIYGLNGCLRTDFDEPSERSSKRARTTNSLPVLDEFVAVNANTTVPTNNKSSASREEPFLETDRDIGYNQEENRSHLFDLSSLETPAKGNNNSLNGKNVQSNKDKRPVNDLVGGAFMTREECGGTSLFDEKLKSQEKEPKQVEEQGDKESIEHVKSGVKSVMEKCPVERITCMNKTSPMMAGAESIEHVKSRVKIVMEKSPTEGITTCMSKTSPEVTRAESIEHVKSRVKIVMEKCPTEGIMPCMNKTSPEMTGTKSIEHVKSRVKIVMEKCPTEGITPCMNKTSPEMTGAELSGASDICNFRDEKMKLLEKEQEQMGARGEILPSGPAKSKCILTDCAEMTQGGASEVGKETSTSKNDPMEMDIEEEKEVNVMNTPCKMVKSEPVDSIDTSPLSSSSRTSCSVLVCSRDYLELPNYWPKKKDLNRKSIVYLRDPENRVWPALYLKNKHFTALTSGWREFCIRNEVEPNDTCVFRAVRVNEYSVSILDASSGVKGSN